MHVEPGQKENKAGFFSSGNDFLTSCWFTSKLLYSSLLPPSFLEQPYLEQEASSGLQMWSGCDIIPISMVNARWLLSSPLSKSTWWVPTCSGTEHFLTHGCMIEKLFSMLDSFHGPARPQVPHLSIANSHHTAKEQTWCQSGLLKRIQPFATPAKSW